MRVVFLVAFITSLLLAVRLMFFGAERRRAQARAVFPLRISEPAIVAFLMMFGVAGYLLTRQGYMTPGFASATAIGLGVSFALLIAWLAIATARIQPEHDPDDPRFALQGRVGIVTSAIEAGGEGLIRFEDAGALHTVRAREIDGGVIDAGQEVCIERVDDGVARVELWARVEQRL